VCFSPSCFKGNGLGYVDQCVVWELMSVLCIIALGISVYMSKMSYTLLNCLGGCVPKFCFIMHYRLV
jgi:hypothetical protein